MEFKPEQESDAGWGDPPYEDVIKLKGSVKLVKILGSSALARNITAHEKGFNNRWHKVTILGAKTYNKEYIYDLLQEQFFYCPTFYTHWPCILFRVHGNDYCFLTRACETPLRRMVAKNMQLVLSTSDLSKALDIEVDLNYCRYNLSKVLMDIVTRRYDIATCHLDLSDIGAEEGPFYSPKTSSVPLMQLMKVAEDQMLKVESLSLASNKIDSLSRKPNQLGLSNFPNLKKLNLRENKLDSLHRVKIPKQIVLKELILDKNPLCLDYRDPAMYIRSVLQIFPGLKKLDEVQLDHPGLPPWFQNSSVKHSIIPLIDQFLKHFFTYYDMPDRQHLLLTYNKDGLFSMSAAYPLNTTPANFPANLSHYLSNSRNILKLSDFSKTYNFLSQGCTEIIGTLKKLPQSEHDPYSFCVDVVQVTRSHLVINVSGVFRELPNPGPAKTFSFFRTFVLVNVSSDEFQIVNDMLHVACATQKQIEKAFSVLKPAEATFLSQLPLNLYESEKEQMAFILSQITSMNAKWCRKYLNESSWNMKEALLVFTELLKMRKVPPEAFFNV